VLPIKLSQGSTDAPGLENSSFFQTSVFERKSNVSLKMNTEKKRLFQTTIQDDEKDRKSWED
jgi:hypothetical protein